MKRLLAILIALLLLTGCAAAPSESASDSLSDDDGGFAWEDEGTWDDEYWEENESDPEEEPASSSSEPARKAEPKPADRLLISEPELICKDAQMPFTLDGTFSTLRQDDGSVWYWQTANGSKPYYFLMKGTEEDPLQEQIATFEWDFNGYRTNRASTCWVQNLYECEDGTLIGFVHREDLKLTNDAGTYNFWIGLAISEDGGLHWKYGGDIVGTPMNWKMKESQPNMGGVPYIVVGDYFYLYYNEYALDSLRYIGVARCRVDETIEALKNGTLPEVYKLGQDGWNVEPLEGLGKMVVPGTSTGYHDSHADAAWCEPLGMYLMTVQTHSMGKLLMYFSDDGVNWHDPVELDFVKTGDRMHPYSTFVGLEGSSDDFSTLGAHFYVYFPRKGLSGPTYAIDDFYRVEIQVLDENGEPME